MSALVVVGRGPDWSDMTLHRACRRILGSSRIVRACDLSASVGPEGLRLWHGSGELEAPDVCFIRALGPGNHEQLVARAAVLRALELAGSTLINSISALERARDKFSALLALRSAGLEVPRTFLTESPYLAYALCREMDKFVFKPLTGSLGFGSMVFEDRDMAFNILKRLEEHGCPLHVQEFVEDVERELRLFVVDGQVVACAEKRARPGSWKRNVAQGGSMVKAEAPEELEKACVRVVEALGLFYAGVDVLKTRSGSFVALEVNGAPNWRGLQEATGINIAELLVSRVAEKLRN